MAVFIVSAWLYQAEPLILLEEGLAVGRFHNLPLHILSSHKSYFQNRSHRPKLKVSNQNAKYQNISIKQYVKLNMLIVSNTLIVPVNKKNSCQYTPGQP